MANEEHLRILNSGVETWNQWREDNPHVVPDLSGADLTKMNLSGMNLYGVNFYKANLYKVNFYKANLYKANLYKANLYKANLYKANLYKANLYKANLYKAILTKADLHKANLYKADLTGAILSDIKASVFDYYRRNANEVAEWLTYLKDGKVNGSDYQGDCCCLIGTIAKIKGVNYRVLERDASSPCEKFLTAVTTGDTPENNPVAQIIYDWGMEFLRGEGTLVESE